MEQLKKASCLATNVGVLAFFRTDDVDKHASESRADSIQGRKSFTAYFYATLLSNVNEVVEVHNKMITDYIMLQPSLIGKPYVVCVTVTCILINIWQQMP